MTTTYSVEFIDNPQTVLTAASELLEADPVIWSVVASVTHDAARLFASDEPRPSHPMWWALVRDANECVIGVAMRTMPHPPHTVWVPALPQDAVRLLARAALDRTIRTGDAPLISAKGPVPAVKAFADEVTLITGGTVDVERPERLWEATKIIAPVPVPSGHARLATLDDLDLVTAWSDVFHTEADAQANRSASTKSKRRLNSSQRRIEEGGVWLWDVGGTVMHMTVVRPPSFGMARITVVYTPAEHRGHKYAQTLVALVAQQVLDAGHRVGLYTDLDNPVSNHVYAQIGFEPVLDQVSLLMDHAGSSVNQ